MNKQMMIGRLTKDPELRHTTAGNAVASFTVAVDRTYGENKGADYMPCVAWKKTAELISQYASKGRLIYVEGHGQFRKYTKNNQEVKVYEVVVDSFELLDKKPTTTGEEYDQYLDDDGDVPF